MDSTRTVGDETKIIELDQDSTIPFFVGFLSARATTARVLVAPMPNVHYLDCILREVRMASTPCMVVPERP